MKKKLESLARTKYFWGLVVLVVLIIIGCILWGIEAKKGSEKPSAPVEEEEGGLTVMETDDGTGDSIDFEDIVEDVKNKDGVVLKPGENATVVSDGNNKYHLEDKDGNPGVDSNGNVVNTDKDGNPTNNGNGTGSEDKKEDDKKPGNDTNVGTDTGAFGPLF